MQLHSSALRYIDEIARCGSIRAAARKLNIASSAVNRQLLNLEADLGTRLFERNNRALRLTAAGEVLIHHIRQTLQGAERAKSQIDDLQGLRRGEVSLAVIEGVGTDMLTDVLRKFSRRYPRIKFTVRVMQSANVANAVTSGDAHLGLAFNVPMTRDTWRLATATFDVGVVMRPDHPLASVGPLRLTDCLQYPICMPDESLSVRSLIDQALSKSSIEIDPYITCNSAEVLTSMVIDDLGIMFKSIVGLKRHIDGGRVIFRSLDTKIMEKLVLFTKKGRELPVAAEVLAEELRMTLDGFGQAA